MLILRCLKKINTAIVPAVEELPGSVLSILMKVVGIYRYALTQFSRF